MEIGDGSAVKRVQIVMVVPAELRFEVKLRAMCRNMTMKDYIIMAVVKQIEFDKQYEGKE